MSEQDHMIKGTSSAPSIVVVERNTTMIELFLDVLQEIGFEAVGCTGVNEASMLIAKHQPGLVILNIAMPGDPYVQLLRNLQEQPSTSSIAIIVVTTVPDIVTHHRLNIRHDVLSVIPLPFDLDDFNRIVQNIMLGPAQKPQSQGHKAGCARAIPLILVVLTLLHLMLVNSMPPAILTVLSHTHHKACAASANRSAMTAISRGRKRCQSASPRTIRSACTREGSM